MPFMNTKEPSDKLLLLLNSGPEFGGNRVLISILFRGSILAVEYMNYLIQTTEFLASFHQRNVPLCYVLYLALLES